MQTRFDISMLTEPEQAKYRQQRYHLQQRTQARIESLLEQQERERQQLQRDALQASGINPETIKLH